MGLDIAKSLRIAIKDGKISFGAKSALKSIQKGDAQLIVLASNCPSTFREAITSTNIPIASIKMNSVELGSICGKPFIISALSVIDPGSSDIMSIREKEISDDRS
jgi:large subunit ribosomal protein L30e